jgi:hypothetical protein
VAGAGARLNRHARAVARDGRDIRTKSSSSPQHDGATTDLGNVTSATADCGSLTPRTTVRTTTPQTVEPSAETVAETIQETVEVHGDGETTDAEAAFARRALAEVVATAPAGVSGARVVIVPPAGPSVPATVKARVALEDGVVHSRGVAPTVRAAAEAACARLRRQLAHLSEPALPVRPTHGLHRTWRHGEGPAEQPPFLVRPPDQRAIARRKTYDGTPVTVEAAIRAASLLDVDFFLFTNATTGNDAVVRRVEGNTWALVEARRPNGLNDARAGTDVAVRCGIDEAAELLDVSNARFVFFVEPGTQRLHALYRRYDGNYALVAPPD